MINYVMKFEWLMLNVTAVGLKQKGKLFGLFLTYFWPIWAALVVDVIVIGTPISAESEFFE